MLKLLIHEKIYIYYTSQRVQVTEKGTKRILRIAQIAPPEISVPPKTYGGIERTISYLTEEQVRRGHKVTLFATTDSKTTAKLIAKWPAYNQDPVPKERYVWMFDQVRKNATKFDILHFHTDAHFELVDEIVKDNKAACVVTVHGHMEWYPTLGFDHNKLPLITISDDQRLHSSGNPNYIGTAYHGLPKDHYKFIEKPNSEKPYLAFLGRMVPEKRPEWAIEIAVKTGYHLKMGAKILESYNDYWEKIKKLIEKHKDIVEFVGEVNEKQKNDFLGKAFAFLNPIDWAEQFGYVMIESMACGTPVITRRMGSVPEIIEDGVSGIIFETIDEGVKAVKKSLKMSRKAVREAFLRRFTIEHNADQIEKIYNERLKLRNG
ncbi:hypothetical protein ACQ4LE_007337 [Meloidogyne hapla]